MKRLIMLIVTLAVVIAPVGAGAQQSGGKAAPPAAQPQSPEVKAEPGGAAKSYTPDERKAYEKKVAADLDEMQQNIGNLRVESRKGAPQKKNMILMAAKNLQFQTIAARNQLAQLEKAPADTWSGGKANLDKAMADLRQAWEAAAPLLH